MNQSYLIILFFILIQCKEARVDSSQIATDLNTTESKVIAIEDVVVNKKDLILNQLKGVWFYNQKPFNGFAVKHYPNGKLEEKLGFFNGKREGVAKRWSENGILRVESHYKQNKLVGIYKSWWENEVLAEEVTYVDGVKEGVEMQWYDNGQLSKTRNLNKGQENGMQKAWLKNGTLYVNYEAKNGRVFGLMRSNLCYQLEDEVVLK